MIENVTDAALIIAYRRWDNVAKLIEILRVQGVKRIYIAIDRNSSSDIDVITDVGRTIEIAMDAKKVAPNAIQVAVHTENVGCSAAVLSACQWFYENEEFGVVFEDDCIPANEFFTYANKSRQVIESNNDVWLFCGTQFASELPSQDSWSLSKYALIWGWGTSRAKWNQIAAAMKRGALNVQNDNIGIAEKQYWKAGAVRSSSGIVDAWDNILIQNMLSLGKKAILPQYALVSNVGNDSAATHTIGDSSWLRIETGSFGVPAHVPIENQILDSWLKDKFYKISLRHIVTTRVTRLLDFITMRKMRAVDLATRWENARKNLVPLQ
jgi:hypothetical protein